MIGILARAKKPSDIETIEQTRLMEINQQIEKTLFEATTHDSPDRPFITPIEIRGIEIWKESSAENPRIDISPFEKRIFWHALSRLLDKGFEVKVRALVDTDIGLELFPNPYFDSYIFRLTPRIGIAKFAEEPPQGFIRPNQPLFPGINESNILTLKGEANALVSAAEIIDKLNKRANDLILDNLEVDPPIVEFPELTTNSSDLFCNLRLSQSDHLTFEIVLAHLLKQTPVKDNYRQLFQRYASPLIRFCQSKEAYEICAHIEDE